MIFMGILHNFLKILSESFKNPSASLWGSAKTEKKMVLVDPVNQAQFISLSLKTREPVETPLRSLELALQPSQPPAQMCLPDLQT